jgi:hypothetical protein
MKYNINWTNDVGAEDDYYHEFWEIWEGEIYKGRVIARCDKESDAVAIVDALNKA